MVESIAATAGGGGSAPAANEPARERGVSDSRVSASGSGSGSGPAWAAAPARVLALALAPAPALALAPAPDPALAPVAAARRTSSCARPATGWCLAGPWRRRRAASRPCPALCLGLTLSDTDHRRGRADRRLLARTTAAAAAAAEHADPRWLDPPAWPSGDHAAARPATQRTGRGAGGRWRRQRDGLTGCHNNSCAKPWPARTLAHRAAPRPHSRPRSAKVRMRGAPARPGRRSRLKCFGILV